MTTRSPSTSPAVTVLAGFAAGLERGDIPDAVAERATHCLIDAVACAIFGARFPWSESLRAQTGLRDAAGFLPISDSASPTAIREAALVWGAQAHAFELDSLRKPGAGVHAGATVALPALAMAHALSASGPELIRAIVAGCEVMFRIGAATLHTPEKRGFHAPGVTGPFGSAVACGVLMGLTAAQLANALGIAASLGGGLLAFSKAERGGMVKRLHLGRAAEAGVLAAQLAASGYEGPDTVLDGRFGVLEAFCDAADPTLLTAALGTVWQTETLCLKQFACHVTAHPPVQLLRTLMQEHGFGGRDIAELRLGVGEKVLSHHAGRRPTDIMQAQYSVPFMTATAAFRDVADPRALADDILSDPEIRRLADSIVLEKRRAGGDKGWGVEIALHLRDGRRIDAALDGFLGCPETPFSLDRLRDKFRLLAGTETTDRRPLFDALASIETLGDVRRLWTLPDPGAHRTT
jgi:2-methylcitrate dehydratase PrpD